MLFVKASPKSSRMSVGPRGWRELDDRYRLTNRYGSSLVIGNIIDEPMVPEDKKIRAGDCREVACRMPQRVAQS
jgi:hypothetical protein